MILTSDRRGREQCQSQNPTFVKVYVGNIGAENMRRLKDGIVKTWGETLNVEEVNTLGENYNPDFKLGSIFIVPGVFQWEGE